jgi:hypothetical protein
MLWEIRSSNAYHVNHTIHVRGICKMIFTHFLITVHPCIIIVKLSICLFIYLVYIYVLVIYAFILCLHVILNQTYCEH